MIHLIRNKNEKCFILYVAYYIPTWSGIYILGSVYISTEMMNWLISEGSLGAVNVYDAYILSWHLPSPHRQMVILETLEATAKEAAASLVEPGSATIPNSFRTCTSQDLRVCVTAALCSGLQKMNRASESLRSLVHEASVWNTRSLSGTLGYCRGH